MRVEFKALTYKRDTETVSRPQPKFTDLIYYLEYGDSQSDLEDVSTHIAGREKVYRAFSLIKDFTLKFTEYQILTFYKELKKRGKSFNHKGFSPCKIYSGLRKTL